MVNKTTFPQTSSIGSSGEHLVLSQLLKMNFVAGLAPENTKDYDLIVLNREGNISFPIQVKTALHTKTSNKLDGWILGEKHEQSIKGLVFCFVRMNLDSRETDIYLIDSDTVAYTCRISNQIWLKIPGRDGRKHNPSSMRKLQPDYNEISGLKKIEDKDNFLNEEELKFLNDFQLGWLNQYKEAWNLIRA